MSDTTPIPTATCPPAPCIPDPPTGVLLEIIIGFLAPIFLFGCRGDIVQARLAAIGTVNAYRIETQSDLIAVANIIAFSLASLAALGRAMEDDVPARLALRLYNSATACSRAADKSGRCLGQNRPTRRPEGTRRQDAPGGAPSAKPPTQPAAAASDSRPPSPAKPAPARPAVPSPATAARQPVPRDAAPLPTAPTRPTTLLAFHATKPKADLRSALLSTCVSDLLHPAVIADRYSQSAERRHPLGP